MKPLPLLILVLIIISAVTLGVLSSPALAMGFSHTPQIANSNISADNPEGVSMPSAASSSITRLNMKSYGDHDANYDARILTIQPKYVLDNPPHGLYGEMESPQYTASWLLQNVSGYQAAGIKVIGYLTSGYEGKGGDDRYSLSWYSLEMNKKLIKNMATLDHVDGVFIDECSDYPNASSKAYLKTLTTLAHSYGLITWGNVGVDDFDSWFFTDGGFDLMQSSESWVGQALSPVQKAYGSRISVTGYNSRYTADDAQRLTLDAWNKGIAYCYINTVEYTSIAPWFEGYAARLRTAQNNYSWPPDPIIGPPPTSTPSPTPTPTPTSTPTPTPTPTPGSLNVYTSNTTTDSVDWIGGSEWRAQSFTPSTSHTLSQVKLILNKTGNPSGSVVVHIRTTDANGLPTGSDLATGSILTSSISGSNWYSFNLNTGVKLVAGTKYSILMQASGSDLSSNIVWYGVSTANPYSSGWITQSLNNASTWSDVVSRTYDAGFQELGTP
jgi:hypothetical protein